MTTESQAVLSDALVRAAAAAAPITRSSRTDDIPVNWDERTVLTTMLDYARVTADHHFRPGQPSALGGVLLDRVILLGHPSSSPCVIAERPWPVEPSKGLVSVCSWSRAVSWLRSSPGAVGQPG